MNNEDLQHKKSLTLNGMTLPNLALIILSIGIVSVSIYMTSHFFSEHFPTTLGSSSKFCDISSFWNCDSATFSNLSAIALIPISVFSLILGLFFLAHSIFPSVGSEKTGKFLAFLNMAGCLGLFFYSLAVLGSLCPFCTVYYTLSLGIFLLFLFKSSLSPIPDFKISAIWVVLAIAAMIGVRMYHQKKIDHQEIINKQIVKQFFELPKGEMPDNTFGLSLLKTEGDAPIKVAMFSDFQCPYCKLLAEDLEKAAKQYQGKVEATYFFYPLDPNCNPNVKSAFHTYACQAAYLAYCSKDFKETHDAIYEHQKDFQNGALEEMIKDQGLEACINDPKTKEAIVNSIMHGDAKFNVQATPTLFINGVRIKPLPSSQFRALFQAILEK